MKNTIIMSLFGASILLASLWKSSSIISEEKDKKILILTKEGLIKDSIIEKLSDPAYQVDQINLVDSLREKAHKHH